MTKTRLTYSSTAKYRSAEECQGQRAAGGRQIIEEDLPPFAAPPLLLTLTAQLILKPRLALIALSFGLSLTGQLCVDATRCFGLCLCNPFFSGGGGIDPVSSAQGRTH